MRTSFHVNKLVAIFVMVGIVLTFGISQAAQEQMDTKAKSRVIKGVDEMLAGKKMLMDALGKRTLLKDPKLAAGIKTLADGEKLALKGKEMMKQKAEKGEIKGKEEVMSGTTKMMEGKDAIINELKARGMLQEGKLKDAEKDIVQGDKMMLEGKNMMMDGLKNYK